MKEQQKPIILEIEEAKMELIQSVNDIMARHNLPCYLLEPAFKDAYEQMKVGAQNEVKQAKTQWAAAQVQSAEPQIEVLET